MQVCKQGTSINNNLVKAIADVAIFLEFTHENLLNADSAVEAMEQLASQLQLMNAEERGELCNRLRELSIGYDDPDAAQFVRDLPESLGLA